MVYGRFDFRADLEYLKFPSIRPRRNQSLSFPRRCVLFWFRLGRVRYYLTYSFRWRVFTAEIDHGLIQLATGHVAAAAYHSGHAAGIFDTATRIGVQEHEVRRRPLGDSTHTFGAAQKPCQRRDKVNALPPG